MQPNQYAGARDGLSTTTTLFNALYLVHERQYELFFIVRVTLRASVLVLDK